MSENIVYLKEDNFDNEVINYNGVVLVDFYADWCGPCRMLAPTMEKLADDFLDKAKICKLNTDDAPTIAGKFGIQGIPTVLIFKNGKVEENLVGFKPIEEYETIINNLI